MKEQYSIRDFKFWRIMIGFALASYLVFSNLYIVQPLLPEFVRDFNISPTMASLSLSLSTMSLVVGLLFFGFYSDRIGRLPILQWSLTLSTIPLFLIPFIDSYLWLLLCRFVAGFTLAGLPAVGVAYISEEIQLKHRGFAVSLFIACNGFGGMIGRVIGGYIADNFSWQAAFFTLGVTGVLISVICFMIFPKSRFFKRHDRPILEDLKGMAVHLKNPLLVVTFILGVMLQISFSGIWTYLPFYLEGDPFYLSIKVISLTYFTYIFGVIGSPYAGYLASRFGIVKVLVSGIAIFVLGSLITMIPNTRLVILGLSIICLGFFIAHSMASTWVGVNAKHHKSGATSLYLVSYYLGVSLAGIVSGSLWSAYEWQGVIIVGVGLLIVSGFIFYTVARNKDPLYVKKVS